MRDRPARRVDERRGEEVRRDPGPAALAHDVVLLEDRDEPADRRSDEHADPLEVEPRQVGVVDGLARRGHREQDVAIEPSRLLGRRDHRRIEVGDLSHDGDRKVARVEVRGLADAGPALENRVPGHVGADPDRRHDSDSGDGDAHVTNLVDRSRGLADALPCARRTRASVPGRSASTDCRGDHGLHPGRTGARGGSPLPAPRRDIARNDHGGARPGSRRPDPQLHRLPREGGLLRRPELPPRRARLRAPGRLPRRVPAPGTRATRSSGRRRATTSTRSATSRWRRRATRLPAPPDRSSS